MKRAHSLALALWLAPGAAAAFPVTVLQETGPVTKRYNIAVLGDGYRSDDQAKLTTDATNLIDDIFEQAPYASYRGLFNIKIVQAVSIDRGARGGTAGGTPNTAFSANFSCDGVSRLLCVNERAVIAAAARDVPEYNLAVVIVNDTKYGGSGGDVPCVSTNRQAAEIFVLGPDGKKMGFARFGEGDAPRTLAFIPVTPETLRAGIAGDLLVVTVSRGAWPVNEVVRVSGPFERFVQEGAAAPR